MLNELFHSMEETASSLSTMFTGIFAKQGLHTITVAKPYCVPARHSVMQITKRYGIKVHQIRCMTDVKRFDGKNLPTAEIAHVTVSKNQANWAEYCLARSRKFWFPDGILNRRNHDLAEKHGGKMHRAWREGKPVIEKSCEDGKARWLQMKQGSKRK